MWSSSWFETASQYPEVKISSEPNSKTFTGIKKSGVVIVLIACHFCALTTEARFVHFNGIQWREQTTSLRVKQNRGSIQVYHFGAFPLLTRHFGEKERGEAQEADKALSSCFIYSGGYFSQPQHSDRFPSKLITGEPITTIKQLFRHFHKQPRWLPQSWNIHLHLYETKKKVIAMSPILSWP